MNQVIPIYVDALMNHGWNLGPSCHMFIDPSDNLVSLHSFAARVGLKREWFQHKEGGAPHYDLTAKRRSRAVLLGAIELDRRDAVNIFRRWKGLPERQVV